MPINLRDGLPDALRDVRTTPLFIMRLDLRPLQVIGATPGAFRRVGVVTGGAFQANVFPAKYWTAAATGRMSAAKAAPLSMCGWCSRRLALR
jgi:hypothetical protein